MARREARAKRKVARVTAELVGIMKKAGHGAALYPKGSDNNLHVTDEEKNNDTSYKRGVSGTKVKTISGKRWSADETNILPRSRLWTTIS